MQDETNEEQLQQPEETPPALPTRPGRRIPALSVHGDEVWQVAQPLLSWAIDNGDEELRAKALRARAYWEQEQAYFIEWGNKTGLFEYTQAAIQDIQGFKKAMKTLPAETHMTMDYYPDGQSEPKQVDVVIWLALKAAERLLKTPRGSSKIVKFRGKKQQ